MRHDTTLDHLRERGFDRSSRAPRSRTVTVRCSQCEALVINGTPTHERGCPNTPRPVRDDEE